MKVSWPHPRLFPNAHRGRSHRVYQTQKAEARREGFYVAKAAKVKLPAGNLVLHVLFAEPNRQRRDMDGMLGAVKSHIDGMCKALKIDDSQFVSIVLERYYDPEKKGFVQFTIGSTSNTGA